jgi:hypothetical protein
MEQVYVGLDLGSSSFHQIAIGGDGSVIVNRSFCTSELNLRVERESHIPEWLEKSRKPKAVSKTVCRASGSVTGKQLLD